MGIARNLYDILGVAETASTEELRKAYRAIARASHPDKNPGNAEAAARFNEATEAYTVLSDPGKRARYDRSNSAPQTLHDLFMRPAGLRLFSALLPSAPKASQQGGHAVVSGEIRDGKVVVEQREFFVPSTGPTPRWLRIIGAGGEGRNAGEPGDLFVALNKKGMGNGNRQ